MTGTIGGRAIALAVMPIATRLYSPEDFSLLAIYLSVVGVVGVAACLRLDVAIPLARDSRAAAHLLALSLLSTVSIAALLLIVALAIPAPLARLLGREDMAPYLWLIPLGVMMAGSYSALQFWATRLRRFGDIARTRVTQAAMGAGTMIVLGWAGLVPLGLLIGNMFNSGAGGSSLALRAWRQDRTRLARISRRGLWATLRRYRRYPLYSTPEAFANTAGMQVSILLIAAYAGAEAGYLLLAMQVMTAPMTLLGSSISQVYTSRAEGEFRGGRLAPFTFGIMRKLALIGAPPLILGGILAPVVFPWIFGADWQRAGEIVAWMIPWMIAQFIASPVSMVMFVTGRQRQMLILTVTGGLLRIGSIIAASKMGYAALVEVFSLASATFYIVCAVVFIAAARTKWQKAI